MAGTWTFLGMERQYLGSEVLAVAAEPGREPGCGGTDGSCPRAGLGLGKPLAVCPSPRLQMPLRGQYSPGTWSLWDWKFPLRGIHHSPAPLAGQWPGYEDMRERAVGWGPF